MDAMFVELPAFQRHRETYLDDEGYRALQQALLTSPEAGPVIPGAGGPEFWLFTLYDKDEATDLTSAEKAMVRELIKAELAARAG